jgi:hypothetical protein
VTYTRTRTMSASSDEGDDATDGGTYQHARPFGKDTGSLLRHPPQRQERRNASPTTAIVGHQHAQDRRHIARLGLPTTPGRMSRDGPRCRSQAGRGTDGRVLLEVGIKRGVSTWRTLKGLHQRLLPPLQAVLRSAHTPSVRVYRNDRCVLPLPYSVVLGGLVLVGLVAKDSCAVGQLCNVDRRQCVLTPTLRSPASTHLRKTASHRHAARPHRAAARGRRPPAPLPSGWRGRGLRHCVAPAPGSRPTVQAACRCSAGVDMRPQAARVADIPRPPQPTTHGRSSESFISQAPSSFPRWAHEPRSPTSAAWCRRTRVRDRPAPPGPRRAALARRTTRPSRARGSVEGPPPAGLGRPLQG